MKNKSNLLVDKVENLRNLVEKHQEIIKILKNKILTSIQKANFYGN